MSTNIENEVKQGLDFVLSHLNQNQNQPLWPRTIATKFTNHAQVVVYSKEEALKMYKDSNYFDCRISAYPYKDTNNGSKVQIIDFLLIDLDLSSFGYSKQALDKWLFKILKRINKMFDSNFKPTVIWSGNGYHIYIKFEPLNCILEEMSEFATFEEPSIKYLRFIERELSNGKCDFSHNSSVAFSNCMLRIPGSLNSKDNANTKVTIKQICNFNQPLFPLKLFLGDFLASLVDKEKELVRKCSKPSSISSKNSNSFSIIWIELLLKTGLRDFRKYSIWRILSPYLINKRGLNEDKSYSIIEEWLNKCDQLEPLNFDADYKIIEGINGAIDKGCYPISLKDLKEEQPELYNIVWDLIRCKN